MERNKYLDSQDVHRIQTACVFAMFSSTRIPDELKIKRVHIVGVNDFRSQAVSKVDHRCLP